MEEQGGGKVRGTSFLCCALLEFLARPNAESASSESLRPPADVRKYKSSGQRSTMAVLPRAAAHARC